MTPIETWLFWIAVFVYTASSVGFLGALVFKRPRIISLSVVAAAVGLAMHTAAVIVRWSATGHPPLVGSDYESALARSWVIIAIFLGLQVKFRSLRALGVALLPFSLLMLGYGALRRPSLDPLTPVFKSPWLFVHVTFAWFAYASFVVSAGLAPFFLLKARRAEAAGWYARLPSIGVLDELGYRLIAFGFIAASVMIVAGAIWANSLWGSYWSWDPIQTWALISWLVYALYLHLRVIHKWRLKRAAWMSISALATVLISSWATNFLGTGLHVFR